MQASVHRLTQACADGFSNLRHRVRRLNRIGVSEGWYTPGQINHRDASLEGGTKDHIVE